MKIQVEHKNGEKEIITLVPPIEVFDQEGFNLHHLHCGDGTDYYFNLDGTYDGWGRAMCGSFEEAQQEIRRMVDSKEVPEQ